VAPTTGASHGALEQKMSSSYSEYTQKKDKMIRTIRSEQAPNKEQLVTTNRRSVSCGISDEILTAFDGKYRDDWSSGRNE